MLSVAIKRWLREPLLHFVLIGLILFAAYGYLQSDNESDESSNQIVLTTDDIRQLNIYFVSQWKRPPLPEELEAMVEDKIREEVLYREALSMGLDKGDTIVKRRMAQKMQFLAEDIAAARNPTTEELKAWYNKNTNLFALPSRISFRHLYFSPDKRGQYVYGDASKALEKMANEPIDSDLSEPPSDQFMFQDYYGDRTTEQLSKEFGPQFATEVAKLKPGSWQGPVESGYGWHLVFVDSVIPGRNPDFEEIEQDVKIAWMGEQKQKARQEAYEKIRDKYTVLIPAPPANRSTQQSLDHDKDQVSKLSGEVPE